MARIKNTTLQKKVRSKRLVRNKLIKALESMYVNNPGMSTDIDSYNYGIHDSVEKIKKLL
jgi:hypothetical protein